jgi:hypothetical protein
LKQKTEKPTLNEDHAKVDDNLASDYSSKSVGNTERPHGTICCRCLETANFQNGDNLAVLYQGRDEIYNPIF